MENCQFCDECNHKSKECKKYPTDRTRKVIADKKKFCRYCFIKSDKLHLPNTKECPTNKNCIGWYSVDHHIAFCQDKVTGMAQNLFLPKIDRDLLQRFIETFELEEQLAFGLSSQNVQKYVSLKNIRLTNLFFEGKFRRKMNSSVAVIRNLGIDDTNKEFIFKEITSKKVFWKVRIIQIGTLNLSVQELSKLIGSYTKELTIKKISSNITFADIIRNAPNIEVLKIFHNTWISKQTTWLEDLYKFKEGKNFRELWIHLNTIEFDAETLKKFVETKSINGVFIKIRYQNKEKQKAFHQFANKMSKIFNKKNTCLDYGEIPHIKLEFDGIRDYKCFYFRL